MRCPEATKSRRRIGSFDAVNINHRGMPMPAMSKVWRNASGEMFHDACFEAGESRAGFTEIMLNDLEADDDCDSCGGFFLSGLEPEIDDEDAGDEPDEIESD